MDAFLEMVVELIFTVIGTFLDAWFGDFSWPDTWTSRIVWGVVLLVLGGVIWWEVH
jgi:hypothetical protein